MKRVPALTAGTLVFLSLNRVPIGMESDGAAVAPNATIEKRPMN